MKKSFIFIILNLIVLSSIFSQDALELFRQKNYAEAISVTKLELESNPNNLDAYSVLGWSLNATKQFQESIERVKKGWVAAKNNEDRRIAGVLAEAYAGLGQSLPALEYYQYFLSWGTQDPNWDKRNLRDAYREMGEIYIKIKEYAKADITLAACVANDIGKHAYDAVRASELWALLGFAKEMTGNKSGAKIIYQGALERNANNELAKTGLDRLK